MWEAAGARGMAKKTTKTSRATGKSAGRAPTRKKSVSKKTPSRKASSGGPRSRKEASTGFKTGSAKGRHLVIVESPAKAKTINRYLGDDYLVLASIGHVRDLPSKAKKGEKTPVPGVDLERGFRPTYEILGGKDRVIRELKRAAKEARESGRDVWFATDLDREGEAIAWHLAQELGIEPEEAKRVVFAAITRGEIRHAFEHPHPIDEDKVNAQQARRILDRIVGYQVSPLLWKKVARGLSAGRVQSVAVRLVVDREREIRAFVPDEYWQVEGLFATKVEAAGDLRKAWQAFLEQGEKAPTLRDQNAWLAEHEALRGELVEVDGEKFDISQQGRSEAEDTEAPPAYQDLTTRVVQVLERAGATVEEVGKTEDPQGRGPARRRCTVRVRVDASTPYRVRSIETKRTSVRPPAPFITSTLQQAASSRLSFNAQRTMRAAQQLYEGVEIPGEGPVGLITYMRTDSTHLSREAVEMARSYIGQTYGERYLPKRPNVFTSSNKDAQEAHEAIRPASLEYPPQRVKRALTSDQFRLYSLIWERFVACQMANAQWDSTTVLIEGGRDGSLVFRAGGRTLAFDGFYRVAGVPTASETATLPRLDEGQPVAPFEIDAQQKFTSPPARYSEASLIRKLEEEGIGRPSTYAEIVQKIQARKYVELIDRRFHATDLGEVVTDKLCEAFPRIMDVGYTRQMEEQLDRIEEEHLDWIEMLEAFYGPFRENLERALEELQHAKAEQIPAPKEYRCEKCGSDLVYRFGRNGRFLSCSRYPDCDYACPVDRHGRPRKAEFVDVRCPVTGRPMIRRTGRFGPFLATALEEGEKPEDVGIILNLDKQGRVTAPSRPPLETDLKCPTCESPLYLRSGVRGPWLGCSRFPKCRGRGKWAELDEQTRAALQERLAAHEKAHPIAVIRTYREGKPLTDEHGKPLKDAPKIEELLLDEDPREAQERIAG